MHDLGADRDARKMDGDLGRLLSGADRKGEYHLPSAADFAAVEAISRPGATLEEIMAALAIRGPESGMVGGSERGGRGRGRGQVRGRGRGGAGGGRRGRSHGMSSHEEDERMANYGFTNDEVMELLSQGVKPWDDDAWVRFYTRGINYNTKSWWTV